MRHIIFCLMFIACLSACVADEQQLPTATTISEARPTETATASPVLMPANTATSTHTPPIVPTTTPAPTSTLSPTETPTPLPPFTTGRVVFLWNPEPIPAPEEMGPGMIIRTSLFSAIPGAFPGDWNIESGVEMIGQPYAFLSSTGELLAVVKHDDTNGDGYVITDGGSDISNIHIYDMISGSFTRLTDNAFDSLGVSWSPDSKLISYSQGNDVFLQNLDSTDIEKIGQFSDHVTSLAWSPDKEILAVNRFPGNIDFWNLQTEQIIPVVVNIPESYQLKMRWSYDSQWLVFIRFFNSGLFVLNRDTLEITELVASDLTFPIWSPYTSWLAYTHGTTLFLWDGETQTTREIVTMDTLSEPAWSFDGSKIAVGFLSGSESGLLLVDPITDSLETIDLGMYPSQIFWSPDGQWLLISSVWNNQTGYFLVPAIGGEPSLFLDITGKNFPTQLFWVSTP